MRSEDINPPTHIDQNIATIASLREHAEEDLSTHQRGIESVTAAIGRPRSIYVTLIFASVWCLFNALAPLMDLRAFDPPPFFYLQGLVAFAALLTTTMVLTAQNRQRRQAEHRAHLDLQVNLLAEQKVTKLISLVEELRRDIPTVPDRVDLVAEVMTEPIDPKAVMTAIEDRLEPSASDGGSGDTDAKSARRI